MVLPADLGGANVYEIWSGDIYGGTSYGGYSPDQWAVIDAVDAAAEEEAKIQDFIDSIQALLNKQTGGGGGSYTKPLTAEEKRAIAQDIWESLGCYGLVPQSVIDYFKSKGWFKSSQGALLMAQYIKTTDDYLNGAVGGTERLLWADDWESRIGQPATEEIEQQILDMFKEGWSRTQFNDWIEQQDAYQTGVEMMGIRQNYLDVLYQVWGVGQVDDLIAQWAAEHDGEDYIQDYIIPLLGIGASSGVIADWARQQPEYLTGPAAASTRENLRETYQRIMRRAPDPDWINEKLLDGWNVTQLLQYLRTTDEYQAMYGSMPGYMTEDEYNAMRDAFNAVGRWYYRESGSLVTLTPEEVEALREQYGILDEALPPGVYQNEAGEYVTWEGAWEISDAQLGAMLDAGWTPAEWEQHLRYTEQAIEDLEQMNYLGEALGMEFTDDDAYAYASGGSGSGALRALLNKAQHRRSFDTVFAIINGRMPTLEEYEWLEENFTGADHYYTVMTAQQNAEADFPAIDEMFLRVLGHGADLDKLVEVNRNAAGSGQYEALIQAVEELDRYTTPFRMWAKRNPTPDEYAQWFADLSGPEELEKEIYVLENMRSKGPTIRQSYDSFWAPMGISPLDDDELETLLGQTQGWGSLQARLDMAEERRQRRMAAVEMSLRWGAATTPIAYTEFGGSQAPGLKRIGG